MDACRNRAHNVSLAYLKNMLGCVLHVHAATDINKLTENVYLKQVLECEAEQSRSSLQLGVTIKNSKTKLVGMDCIRAQMEVQINGESMWLVNYFMYLSSWFGEDQSQQDEIKIRIDGEIRSFGAMMKTSILSNVYFGTKVYLSSY